MNPDKINPKFQRMKPKAQVNPVFLKYGSIRSLIFLLNSCSQKQAGQKSNGQPEEPLITNVEDKFLSELKNDIESHKWALFLTKCDPSLKKIQQNKKISDQDFIAGLLGIN